MCILQGCEPNNRTERDTVQVHNSYNICLILDGTDRLTEENGVPQLSLDEIEYFAQKISDNGKGTLYVTYVDNNCDNNQVAIFEWLEDKPVEHGEKLSYMKMLEYKKQQEEEDVIKNAYACRKNSALNEFLNQCSVVHELAYSDIVARQKKGSDVNGAINQASRLLRASRVEGIRSYIILVSDGCDNVGKVLENIEEETELIIVNSNVTKHHFHEYVSKEFVSLKQVINYVFI